MVLIDALRVAADEYIASRKQTDRLRAELTRDFWELVNTQGESMYRVSRRSGIPQTTVQQMVQKLDKDRENLLHIISPGSGYQIEDVPFKISKKHWVYLRQEWNNFGECYLWEVSIGIDTDPESVPIVSSENTYDEIFFERLFGWDWKDQLHKINFR